MGKKLMSSSVMIDKATNEKLLLVSTMKDLGIFHFDPEWKLIKRFDHQFVKGSAFAKDNFRILSTKKESGSWMIIVENDDHDVTIEEIDPEKQSVAVKEILYDPKSSRHFAKDFNVAQTEYRMSLNKNNEFMMYSFDGNSNHSKIKLDLSTDMRYDKKSPYEAIGLFTGLMLLDTFRAMNAYYTGRPVHFYIERDKYLLSVADANRPQAELSTYNKETGKRVTSFTYSVESLLPSSARNDVRTSFVLFDRKAWLLAVYKDGGALGVFDTATNQLVYQFVYTDKSDKNIFNYGPVKFESWVKKESLDEISPGDYSKDISKHGPALWAQPMDPNTYHMILGTYIDKDNILRGFISSNAGLTFHRAPFEHIDEKTNYYSTLVRATDGTFKRRMPVVNISFSGPWARQPYDLSRQVIGNTLYEVSWDHGMLRVTEKIYELENN
jgi:hypothetical protein